MKKQVQKHEGNGVVRDAKFNALIPKLSSSDPPQNAPVSPADLGCKTLPTQTEIIQSTWRVSGQIHSH
jgi:hypothetical protein